MADKTPGEVAWEAYQLALHGDSAGLILDWDEIGDEAKQKAIEVAAQAVREQLEAEQADVDPREDLPGTLRRARKIVRAWRDNLPFESPADARENATEALEDVEALLD